MLLLRLRKIIVGLLLCHILSWCGWRSKYECFINGIGSGRTEGEDQHSPRVNYTRLPLPVLHTIGHHKTCTVQNGTPRYSDTFPTCATVAGTLVSGRWLPRYSQVSVTDHWHSAARPLLFFQLIKRGLMLILQEFSDSMAYMWRWGRQFWLNIFKWRIAD